MSSTSRTLATLSLLFLVGCPAEIPIPVDPPVARKDYAKTPVNTPVTLSPLLNDHDPNAEVMTVLAIGTAAHGTAVLGAGDTVTYTPNAGYTGPDSFSVTIVDASNNEVTENAYVTVGSSTRFAFLSNFEDYFTRQLYFTDDQHPGVAFAINQYLRITKGPAITESNVETYTLSPDRTKAVLIADDSDESNARNIFVVDLAQPGVAIQVTDFDIGEGTSVATPALITADNAYVVYLSNEFNALSLFELVMVEIANPSNRVRLSPALVAGQSLITVRLTPDGSRVLYDLADESSAHTALYATQLAVPGVAVKLSGTATAATPGVIDFGNGNAYEFIPGTTSVLYPAMEAGATTVELWKVDYVAPAAPVKISGTGTIVGVQTFVITQDGARVVYISSEIVPSQVELYAASITTPGPSVRLNTPQTDGKSVLNYGVGQDSTFVVYIVDQVTAGQGELFKVDFATPGVSVKLNATLGTDVDVINIALSTAKPRTVLYTITPDPTKPAEQRVFEVDVDVPGTATEVGPLLTSANNVFPLVSPDGESVFYSADPTFHGIVSMYGLRFDTPTANVKLTPEQYAGAQVSAVRFLN